MFSTTLRKALPVYVFATDSHPTVISPSILLLALVLLSILRVIVVGGGGGGDGGGRRTVARRAITSVVDSSAAARSFASSSRPELVFRSRFRRSRLTRCSSRVTNNICSFPSRHGEEVTGIDRRTCQVYSGPQL